MKLGNVKISFPIKSYESKVNVITPRKPTVIEHQLLETIKSLNNKPQWKDKSINDLFEKLFMVPDPNDFVYPVLQELRRLNVVEFEDSAISNFEIAIGSITITKAGKEMMDRGKLPAAEKEEISTDKFDLISNRSIIDSEINQFQEDYRITHAEIEHTFPKEIIHDSLISSSNSWFKKGISEIRNVEEISSDLIWNSKDCEIELSDNGEITLVTQGIEYQDYLNGHKILGDIIENEFKRKSANSINQESLNISELDKYAYNIKSLNDDLDGMTNSTGEVGIFDSSVQARGEYNISIIANSNINKIQQNGNSFIIYTEKRIPVGNNCLFIDNNNNNLFTNNINVLINNKSDVLPISYSIKSLDKTIDEILTDFQIYLFNIPIDKVGLFIGKARKNIKILMDKYQCKINVNENGKCLVSNLTDQYDQELSEYIDSYLMNIEVGQVYEGEIINILDFGAIVKISPIINGLIHVSELSWESVKVVNKLVSIGDKVRAKLIKIHKDKRKYDFSIKALINNPNKKEKVEKTTIKNASTVYVIDTNVFINEPKLLNEFSSDEFIVVSKKVIDELDNRKQKNTEHDPARWAIINLNNYKNDNIEFTGANLSLLPPDYHKKDPDNLILSVAIKHKKHSPVVLTSDNGLRLKAKAEKIKTISLEEYLEGKNNNE